MPKLFAHCGHLGVLQWAKANGCPPELDFNELFRLWKLERELQ